MNLSSILTRRILAPATVLLVGSAALAGLVTWDGGTNGTAAAWTTTNNWNPNALPTLNDNVQFSLLALGAIPTLMTLSANSTVAQSITFSPGFNATNVTAVQNNTSTANASTIRLYSDTNSILLDFQPGSGSFTIQNGTTGPLNTQIHNNGIINVNAGGRLSILGALNNSTASGFNPTPVLTKTGGGKLVLGSTASNFTGSYIIDTGTIQLLNSALALGNLTNPLTLNASGTLDLNGLSPTVGPLSGSGTITSNATGTAEISVGNGGLAGSSTTFSGAITDGAVAGQVVALRKVGAGTLILEGTQAFTGATTATGGSLLINGNLPATASVSVASGATLGGTGTINPAAPVSVAASGTIAPGAGIGTLSTGPVGFSDTAIFSLEIGATTADQFRTAGAASLAGTIALDLTLLTDPVDDLTFTIIDATAPLLGYPGGARFAYLGNSLDEGEMFTATTGGFTQDFQISYSADAGNDVTLRTVPEPGVLGSLLGGAGLVLGLRRRRK